EPRNKPPFPAQSGLFHQPTVVNNVETLVNVPEIILNGGAAYARIGTANSAGYRLFCVSGHVARPGIYEVSFGPTIRSVIEIAGGVGGTGRLQAVLLGGAAGSFVSPKELDTPLTFEGTRAIGATLGSGVVMRSEEHTSELQSQSNLVCRLLLEKKKKKTKKEKKKKKKKKKKKNKKKKKKTYKKKTKKKKVKKKTKDNTETTT